MFSKKYKIDSFSGSLRLDKGIMATVNSLITILIALMNLEAGARTLYFIYVHFITYVHFSPHYPKQNDGCKYWKHNSIQSVCFHHTKPYGDT